MDFPLMRFWPIDMMRHNRRLPKVCGWGRDAKQTGPEFGLGFERQDLTRPAGSVDRVCQPGPATGTTE